MLRKHLHPDIDPFLGQACPFSLLNYILSFNLESRGLNSILILHFRLFSPFLFDEQFFGFSFDLFHFGAHVEERERRIKAIALSSIDEVVQIKIVAIFPRGGCVKV